jgi:NAD(P)-dependent dehydrogenase (short-subunit alcohol dehydrogenase family)
MRDQVVFITGASTGIGRATALAFAKKGVHVAVCDINVEEGKITCQLVEKEGVKSTFIHCNVADPDACKHAVEKTMERFGKLNYAFNNAGTEGVWGDVANQSIENWKKVIDINLNGVFYCMHYQLPAMLQSGGGAIVNCASILGHVGFAGAPAYVAAKHGVLGLTKNAALEFATQNIRVNAICPGFILTPMLERGGITTNEALKQAIESKHAMNRMGTPEEIANCVVWLCSNESSFVTGHALLADGGYIIQ